MPTYEIAPGHVVTGELYEQVRDLLDTEYPGVLPDLSWEQFIHPVEGALLIPDPSGAVNKVEIILRASPDAVVKVNKWLLPDRRAGQVPAPHNHPWRTMRSKILSGGYRDRVYQTTSGGVAEALHTHEAGGFNVLEHHQFHEVVEVEPGSWTCFVGDVSQPGDWGYLDVAETGWYSHNAQRQPDPGFTAHFHALNPDHGRAEPTARHKPQG